MSVVITNLALNYGRENLSIIPDSFSYDEGFGEITVRTQTSGGGETEIVVGENLEMAFSKFKFQMTNTAQNINLMRDLRALFGPVGIPFTASGTQKDGSIFTRAALQVVITNKWDVNIASDGVLDFELAGSQVI